MCLVKTLSRFISVDWQSVKWGKETQHISYLIWESQRKNRKETFLRFDFLRKSRELQKTCNKLLKQVILVLKISNLKSQTGSPRYLSRYFIRHVNREIEMHTHIYVWCRWFYEIDKHLIQTFTDDTFWYPDCVRKLRFPHSGIVSIVWLPLNNAWPLLFIDSNWSRLSDPPSHAFLLYIYFGVLRSIYSNMYSYI